MAGFGPRPCQVNMEAQERARTSRQHSIVSSGATTFAQHGFDELRQAHLNLVELPQRGSLLSRLESYHQIAGVIWSADTAALGASTLTALQLEPYAAVVWVFIRAPGPDDKKWARQLRCIAELTVEHRHAVRPLPRPVAPLMLMH